MKSVYETVRDDWAAVKGFGKRTGVGLIMGMHMDIATEGVQAGMCGEGMW